MKQCIAFPDKGWIRALSHHMDIEFIADVETLKNSPKCYIAWNPTARQGPGDIWRYRKQHNKPSYFVERGALPDTVIIDPDGFLVDSSSYDRQNWDHPLTIEQHDTVTQYIHHLRTDATSLELQDPNARVDFDIRQHLGIGDAPLVFVPMQLNTDSVIKRWSDWVGNVHKFQDIVVDIAKQNPDTIFLVKNHPIGSSRPMPLGDNVISGDEFHYKSCLMCADKALLINSGIGLQAIAWYTPTIIVGTAFYQFEGLNHKAHNVDELNSLLTEPLEVDVDSAQRFMHFLKYRLYSDCTLVKTERSRHHNRTDAFTFTNVRVFGE